MESKINILFLSSWYPSFNNPTLGNFVQKHAESIALINNVFVVNVFSSSSSRVVSHKTKNLTEIHIGFKSSKIIGVNSIRKHLIYRKECSRIINTNRISIIQANVIYPIGLLAYYLKLKYKIPYVVVEHSTKYLPVRVKTLSIVEKLISKITCKNASYVLPVSENLKNSMLSLDLKGEYKVINNVVDTNNFTFKDNQNNESIFRLVHVSTLNDEHKNFTGLLSAYSQILKQDPEFHLTIISDGDYSVFNQLVLDLKIPSNKLTLYTTKTSTEVAQIMRENNVFVLNSNYENLPCVISEALCLGLPVISTDVGGVSEMIDQSNGVLISRNNVEKLFLALLEMKNNFKKYNLNRISNDAVKRYSYESVSRDFNQIHEKAINENA